MKNTINYMFKSLFSLLIGVFSTFLCNAQHLEMGFQLNYLHFNFPKQTIISNPPTGQYTYTTTVRNNQVSNYYIPSVTLGYAYSLFSKKSYSIDIQSNVVFGLKTQLRYFQLPLMVVYRFGNNNKNNKNFGIGIGSSLHYYKFSKVPYQTKLGVVPEGYLEFSLKKSILRTYSTLGFANTTTTNNSKAYYQFCVSLLRSF
jgi:hypothetical protein